MNPSILANDGVLRAISNATGGFLAGAALTMLVLAIPIAVSLFASYRLDWQQSVSSQSARFDLSLIALPLLAYGLWAFSLSSIDTRTIADIGLIASLPLLFFAALMVLSISFGFLLLINPGKSWLWILHIGLLILMLHGTLPILYDVPRFPWAYKHIGVTSYIQLHHGVNPGLDAYHNWPGFFALGALWTEALGFESSLGFAKWAQLVFNFLYLGPLLMLYGALGRSRQAVWVAAWFFFMTSWVSQDYFAPQAFNFFLFLVVIAVGLNWLGLNPQVRVRKPRAVASNGLQTTGLNATVISNAETSRVPETNANPVSSLEASVNPDSNPEATMNLGSTETTAATGSASFPASTSSSAVSTEISGTEISSTSTTQPQRSNFYFALMRQAVHSDHSGLESTPAQRYGLIAIIVLAFAVIISSHQLTPFMLIAGLVALALWRRSRYPWLPVLLGMLVIVWGLTFAKSYTSSQNQWYSTLGRVFQNLQENTSESLQESQGRVTASLLIKVFVLGIWGLAALGALQQMRRGVVPLRAMLLAIAPFPIILLNSYGGEMLLRIYFFSLPFMTILIAGALPLRDDAVATLAPMPNPPEQSDWRELGWDLFGATSSPIPVIRRATNSWRVVPITGVLSLGLAIGFICTYTAKEKLYRVNPEEVSVLTKLYAKAPPESMLVMLNDQYLPIRLTGNYEGFLHDTWVDTTNDRNRELGRIDLKKMALKLEEENRPMAYLVFSASQRDFFQENNILKPGGYDRFRALLARSKPWKLEWHDGEVEVYALRNLNVPLPKQLPAQNPPAQNPPAQTPARPLLKPLEQTSPERSLVGLK
jgi:hypothetical protein